MSILDGSANLRLPDLWKRQLLARIHRNPETSSYCLVAGANNRY
jgi:hypothetical protein